MLSQNLRTRFVINLQGSSRRVPTARSRPGYALLICLFVAFVSSIAVLGILNTARFETLEQSAKQQSTTAKWAAKAGIEKAIGRLLDSPDLRGTLPRILIPQNSGFPVDTTIQQNGQSLTVTATATVGGISKSEQLTFTIAQLQQRISALPN
jgi:type II secretory pathway component PulK